MAARSPWDSDEIGRARELFASGLTWAEVGAKLGRTGSACRDAVFRHYGKISDGRSCYDGPPIPLTKECTKYRTNCRLGSERLWEAQMRLMAKMERQTLEDLLWPAMRKAAPGTERIYKTSSAERLAA